MCRSIQLLPYSDRLKNLGLETLEVNGDELFMIWFLFTRYFMDFVIFRYRLHLQKAQHVVIDSNLLSLAAVVVFGNIF